MTQIQLPEKVKYIISQLEQAGFEAYAVGGCVRDCLLGRNPSDWDVTTSAKPLEVKEVFGHTIDTGIQHGTVTVMLEREGFEVTTYRIDGEYEDSRHPREVIFTANLIEDLKRRDFTINAFAYNDKSGIVDAFHGMKDLSEGMIRCVGEASERFEEGSALLSAAWIYDRGGDQGSHQNPCADAVSYQRRAHTGRAGKTFDVRPPGCYARRLCVWDHQGGAARAGRSV